MEVAKGTKGGATEARRFFHSHQDSKDTAFFLTTQGMELAKGTKGRAKARRHGGFFIATKTPRTRRFFLTTKGMEVTKGTKGGARRHGGTAVFS
ncbi:MAG: hypothetical protein DA408_16850 [Bacteroidetes bacterium]|nr:MAG: hypothetical protein DA408_16850 [Bacteroidota bacterium]